MAMPMTVTQQINLLPTVSLEKVENNHPIACDMTAFTVTYQRSRIRQTLWFVGALAVLYCLLVAFFLLQLPPPNSIKDATVASTSPLPLALGTLAWMLGQWSPTLWSSSLSQLGWESFEQSLTNAYVEPLEIPTLDLTQATIRNNPVEHLIEVYGKDWINRPLLLKGVWSKEELLDPKRRLSISGLARDTLVLPYFSDARRLALSPDSEASLIRLAEVAPPSLVSALFGDRFTKDRLLGHIYSPLPLILGPLTVPIFVANAEVKTKKDKVATESTPTETDSCDVAAAAPTRRPYTGLHCEPIGNVSVQLAGARAWTLVQTEHWKSLRPTVSPDSRGFFASWAPSIDHVPRYRVRTLPGDAVWVPPWTWHRVDYVVMEDEGEEGGHSSVNGNIDETNDATVALGASLFHFRPVDFVLRNPVYALILAPYLVGEFIGTKTQ